MQQVCFGEDKAKEHLGDLWQHPFVHPTPLPYDFSAQEAYTKNKDAWAPFVIEKDGRLFLLVFSNGYAFGGQRNEVAENSIGKALLPQDCSSFVAQYAVCPHAMFSTKDLTYISMQQWGFFFPGLDSNILNQWQTVIGGWEKESCKRIDLIKDVLKPTPVTAAADIKPGMIWVKTNYKDINKNPEQAFKGGGGHTAWVVGVKGEGSDAKVLTIGTNRAIEDRKEDGTVEGSMRNLSGTYLLQECPAFAAVDGKAVFPPFESQPYPEAVITYFIASHSA